MKKEYSNDEVKVVWQPDLCIHSAICAQGLPQVFDPNRRPWVDLSQAEASAIIAQVRKCPSGALSIEDAKSEQPQNQVRRMAGGAVVIKGSCSVTDEQGNVSQTQNVAFCRCTKSQNLPFCDGSHNR